MKLLETGVDFLGNEYEVRRCWKIETLIRKIANLYADDEWFLEANNYYILNFNQLKEYLKDNYETDDDELSKFRSYSELSEYATELSGDCEYFFNSRKDFVNFELEVLGNSDMSEQDLVNEFNKMNVNDSYYSPYTTFKCIFGEGLNNSKCPKLKLID